MIDSFKGEYSFLSNFYPINAANGSPLSGYQTTEHFYQAMKTLDKDYIYDIIKAKTPGKAKRLGSQAPLREDWNDLKYDLMLSLTREKFNTSKELADKLVDTFPEEIIEGNTWGDTYWGVCKGVGQNNLGKILMIVREEIMIKRGLFVL